MIIDWTIQASDLITLATGIIAAVWLGVQLRDTIRDVAAIVKVHEEQLDDHESRIRVVERRPNGRSNVR